MVASAKQRSVSRPYHKQEDCNGCISSILCNAYDPLYNFFHAKTERFPAIYQMFKCLLSNF